MMLSPMPGTPPKLELRIQSDPAQLAAVRKKVESFASDLAFDDKTVGDIGLVVNETLANIIRHAYKGDTRRPIHIDAHAQQGRLVILIRDWGNGVDPTTLPQPPYDPLTPGGVGLLCIKQLMDSVTYTPQRDGMLTTMIKSQKR
jgi:serine/threonine-protein kinase RsbW